MKVRFFTSRETDRQPFPTGSVSAGEIFVQFEDKKYTLLRVLNEDNEVVARLALNTAFKVEVVEFDDTSAYAEFSTQDVVDY